MSAGDMIYTDYQYEFNGFLMGANTDNIVKNITGLLGLAPLKSTKKSRQGRHGSRFPKQLFGDRVIQFELNCGASTRAEMETKLEDLAMLFGPSDVDIPFVYQRPGRGKRQLWVRPTRGEFNSTYKVALGSADGAVELTAGDPLHYDWLPSATNGLVPAGSTTSGNVVVYNNGKFETERVVITLTGQGTNPVVQNSSDSNKQIKFTGLIMGAADVLVIDVYNRQVTLNGADARQYLATDNQWWKLRKGANTLQVTRTGTTNQIVVAVVHRNAWAA